MRSRSAALLLCAALSAWAPAYAQIQFRSAADVAGLADTGGETNGAAFGDIDNDGWPDLLITRTGRAETAVLYRNRQNGTFARDAFAWQPPTEAVGGLFVDYDRDGDDDLYIVVHQARNELHVNDQGVLTLAPQPDSFFESGVGTGALFADLDGDGFAELFSTHRFAQPNQWVHDPGQPTMRDVAKQVSPLRSGDDVFGAAPFDFDDDGDLDIYIAAFSGANLLHRNDGAGQFRTLADGAGMASDRSSVLALPADIDGDGRAELYVANALGQANQLYTRPSLRVPFVDVAEQAGVANMDNSSGGAWADFDNDGDEDLLISNVAMPFRIYRNDGGRRFTDVASDAVDAAGMPADGTTGVAVSDVDRDGDIDVYLTAAQGSDVLLVNGSPEAGWLRLDFGNDAALAGAHVHVNDGERQQTRFFSVATSIGTQHGSLLHFGLGSSVTDSIAVRVELPDGSVRQWRTPPGLAPLPDVRGAQPSIRRVLAPGPAPGWDGFTSTVEVTNRGGAAAVNLRVLVQIDGPGRSFQQRRSVGTVQADDVVGVQFDSWQPDIPGEWTVTFALETDAGVVDRWTRTYLFHDFEDAAPALGLDDAGPGWAGAFGDYDNDGDLDLYVSNGGSLGQGDNVLFRNDRGAGFSDVTIAAGVADGGNGTGVVFADFDRDGDQDLFIAKGGFSRLGEANRLFQNDGNGSFSDISMAAGLDVSRSSYAAVVGDYDLDGQLDLYVSQLRGQQATFYRNDNGQFEDVTTAKRVQSFFQYSGAAASFSDYDNDGDVDLYAGVFGDFDRFYADIGDTAYAVAQVGGTGDMVGIALGDYDEDGDLDIYTVNQNGRSGLYQNYPELAVLLDVASQSGTENMALGTGCAFVDFDSDGDLDLLVSNAFSEDRVYVNLGDGTFLDQALAFGLADSARARAVLVGDIDNDGDSDVYLVNEGAANRLWSNGGGPNGWLAVSTAGVTSNLDAIGTRLTAWIDGRPQMREVNGTAGMSHSSRITHFGLGTAPGIDSLVVRWPNGRVERHGPAASGSFLRVVEGGALTAVTEISSATTPAAWQLQEAYPNPFNASAVVPFSLSAGAHVRATVHNALGQQVRVLADQHYSSGSHHLRWHGVDGQGAAVASGVYYVRVQVLGERRVRSLVLLQ